MQHETRNWNNLDNHNSSIALERSVINNWERLKPVLPGSTGVLLLLRS